ncbi:MAG TPA: riboflavin kinase, partial [Megamonas hypermegale]|nr:riboflavin kinase [Megamonas hypermegale]
AIKVNRIMLPNGVYIVAAYVDGKKYNAIASIGTNPTFRDISRRVEVNIFDFNKDIYGKIIRVDFLEAIRREIKFTSVDALLNQLKKDVQKAKDYFVTE